MLLNSGGSGLVNNANAHQHHNASQAQMQQVMEVQEEFMKTGDTVSA